MIGWIWHVCVCLFAPLVFWGGGEWRGLVLTWSIWFLFSYFFILSLMMLLFACFVVDFCLLNDAMRSYDGITEEKNLFVLRFGFGGPDFELKQPLNSERGEG